MKTLLPFSLFLVMINLTAAQTRQCVLLNPKGQAVPYANIYNPNLQTGMISGPDGRFAYAPSDFQPTDTLLFSCIGYEDLPVQVAALNAAGLPCTLRMQPKVYETPPAEVVESARGYQRELAGLRHPWPFTKYGYGVTAKQQGGEVGLLIENDQVCQIEKVGFGIAEANPDAIQLEINIYTAENGLPGTPLQQERIFATLTGKQFVEADLSSQEVRVRADFFVTLEFLHRPDQRGMVLFNAKRKGGPLTVVKRANGQWETSPGPSPSIYARLQCATP